MVDFWYPSGTRIEHVAKDTRRAEEYLMQADEVTNISTYVGGGPPRFYLPVDPEMPYTSNYAEIVVNTRSYDDIFPLVDRLEPWMQENYPGAVTRVRFYGVGPSETWKLEWRVSGPAVADIDVLRDATDQMLTILHDSPLAKEVRTDLNNKVKRVVPVYSQERGRWSVITREDLARATRRAYDGQQVGLYREEDDLYPIILRHTEAERSRAVEMDTLQVHGKLMANTVPLSQVTKEIKLDWEEPATGSAAEPSRSGPRPGTPPIPLSRRTCLTRYSRSRCRRATTSISTGRMKARWMQRTRLRPGSFRLSRW
jgi:multidrug efflux pump subunit AcrB